MEKYLKYKRKYLLVKELYAGTIQTPEGQDKPYTLGQLLQAAGVPESETISMDSKKLNQTMLNPLECSSYAAAVASKKDAGDKKYQL